MIEARIDSSAAGPVLIIQETENHDRTIPLDALASWSQLLGITDIGSVVDTIIEYLEGDYQEPSSGESMWTEVEAVLADRERAREDLADRAIAANRAERHPRSADLSAALALHSQQVDDGTSGLLAECQKAARSHLRLACPEPTSTAVRGRKLSCQRSPEPGDKWLTENDRALLADCLEDYLPEVANRGRQFAHELSGNSSDPLGDAGWSQSSEPSLEDVKARYERHA